MKREKQIGEIRNGLAFMESYVSIGRTANLTDSNIHAEEFVRGLLSILYNYNLVNANEHAANFPCIDLLDIEVGLGIQVTSEKGSEKINETLGCLDRNSMNDYLKALKIFTLKPKQNKYTISKSCTGIEFNWRQDVIDFNDTLQAIVNLKEDSLLNRVHEYVINSLTIFSDSKKFTPSLFLPEQDSESAWLSFSAQVTKMNGRDSELKELSNFLKHKNKFLWWMVLGPAGNGKSRIALELCKEYKKKEWHVGFLARTSNHFDWSNYKPYKNTLIIIDYVVGRTVEISDIVLEIAKKSSSFDYVTRILLLERDTNTWLSEFLREDSSSESNKLLSHLYREQQLKLANLSQSVLMELAMDLTSSRNRKWTKETEGKLLNWMNRDKEFCRPLYVMMFVEFPNIDDPIELIRSVLKREEAKRKKQLENEEFHKLENLIFLSTLVGSIRTKEDGFDHISETKVSQLLPNLAILDFNKYCAISGSFDEVDAIPGLRPDLLGELYVLDNLNISGVEGMRFQKLLKLGYDIQASDVIAFVTKCYQDFAGHEGFQKLFNLSTNTKFSRLTKAKLIAQSSCFPSIIHDDFLQKQLDDLTNLYDLHPDELELRKQISMSEYNYAGTLMFHNRYSPFIEAILGIDRNECINEAKKRYSSVISHSEKSSRIKIMAMLNLGIALESSNKDDSIEMYNKVIESELSSNETKACALNNRANIYQKMEDYKSAISDREKVLELDNTSGDRRFVALFGCGESNYSLGRYDLVIQYMSKIIEINDIDRADKLCALIVRSVGYYFLKEKESNAIQDLEDASCILYEYVLDNDIRSNLEGLIKTSDSIKWDEVAKLLESLDDIQMDWAATLQLSIALLLIESKTTNKKMKEKWSRLKEQTMMKANRMRIAIPE